MECERQLAKDCDSDFYVNHHHNLTWLHDAEGCRMTSKSQLELAFLKRLWQVESAPLSATTWRWRSRARKARAPRPQPAAGGRAGRPPAPRPRLAPRSPARPEAAGARPPARAREERGAKHLLRLARLSRLATQPERARRGLPPAATSPCHEAHLLLLCCRHASISASSSARFGLTRALTFFAKGYLLRTSSLLYK